MIRPMGIKESDNRQKKNCILLTIKAFFLCLAFGNSVVWKIWRLNLRLIWVYWWIKLCLNARICSSLKFMSKCNQIRNSNKNKLTENLKTFQLFNSNSINQIDWKIVRSIQSVPQKFNIHSIIPFQYSLKLFL